MTTVNERVSGVHEMDKARGNVSRRTLLGVVMAATATGVAACSDDKGSMKNGKKSPALSPLQQLQADASAMEPTKYVKTYEVGKGKTYSTISSALAAVKTDRAQMIGVSALDEAQSVPWVWSRVRVYPGDYHEFLVIPPHTSVIGMGKDPKEVHVHWDGSENTLQTSGRSVYVRSIHLDHTSLDPMAHPMRESGPSGDVGMVMLQRRTVTFESVHFTSASGAPVGKATNDMTPVGVVLTFRNCVFDGPGQPQSVNLVTGGKGAQMQTTFIGCRIISNFDQHPDPGTSGGGGIGPGAPFGGPDAGLGRKDQVAWIDGSWDVGRSHGLQGLIVVPLVRTMDGKEPLVASTDYYIVNPGQMSGVTTVAPKGNAAHVHQAIPQGYRLPVGGVSVPEQKFYGEPPRASRDLVAGGKAAGTMQVKAGDVFWVPVDLGDFAASVADLRVYGAGGVATTAAAALDHEGAPSTDGNAQTVSRSASTDTLPAPRRWFFPGQGVVWLGVSFQADTEVDAVQAPAAGAWKGTGGSAGAVPTANLTKVAASTPVPKLGMTSKVPDGFPS